MAAALGALGRAAGREGLLKGLLGGRWAPGGARALAKGKGGKGGKGKPKVQRTRKSLDREWRQMRLAEAIAESEPGPKREILKGAMDVLCSGEPGCHLKAFRVASVVLT